MAQDRACAASSRKGQKSLAIGASRALIFDNPRCLVGDVLAEHLGQKMQRGVDAERNTAAGDDARPLLDQHASRTSISG